MDNRNNPMKKILITGANGYIGAKMSLLFSENNNLVSTHCFPNIPNNEQWVKAMNKIEVGDLRSEEVIDKLTDNQYDVVIHLVSLDHHQSDGTPDFVASVNVMPIWNLLEKFSIKKTLKKFIYFSTFQVYGNAAFKEISEEFIPSPKNKYGLTHLLSENICNHYNLTSNINCINVRLTNSYGSPIFDDSNCWWLVINDLCKTAYTKKAIQLHSDGSPQRDFIHSSDIYKAIEILVNTNEKILHKNTFNISSGETLTILELAHMVKSIYKKRYDYDIHISLPNGNNSKSPEKYIKSKRYIVNNNKLKSLGFEPKTDLETGINEIFEYLEGLHNAKY